MNPDRFFMPAYMGMRNIPMTSPMLRMSNSAPKGLGLFNKITSSIRSVKWGNLLNNANKTLNVVNQTIPLVRQAGPMFNNMKSMLRIAKAFGSETNNRNINQNNVINDNSNTIINNDFSKNENLILEKEVQNDNVPNFFI